MPPVSPSAAPITRRAATTSLAPQACPIFTVAAMPKPKTSAKIRNITILALAVAASA